jgi:molecular chaperone IbpA
MSASELQALFNSPYFLAAYSQPERGFPFSNVYLEGENTVIEYALAGFKKENITINVVSNELIVEGTFNPSSTIEPSDWISRNISQKNFKRVLRLKAGTTVSGATFVDGLLTIKVKATEVNKTSVAID